MLRSFYITLLRLHPLPFRQRFGDEMLEIFDCAQNRRSALALLADALLSLLRQWTVRSEFHQPILAVAAADAAPEPPLFHTADPYTPRPAALCMGGFLAFLTLVALGVLIPMGAKRTRAFLIGAHHPLPRLLGVARASVTESGVNTQVDFPALPEDPLRPLAAVYFKVIRVLGAIDADHDLILTPWELVTAPAALRRLDLDHDGSLSAEECGFAARAADPRTPPDVVERARRAFMRNNPVLAALDADHDGEISAAEIANSSAALKRLDRNHDGSLTPDELLPDQATGKAAVIMARLDADGDGVLSVAEQQSDDAEPLRQLLRSADRNHDGKVTTEELTNELRLRIEQSREIEQARRAAGFQ